jgi:acyl CoA:acetate/3-ketoacid CoA transferase beta subunit
MIEVTGPGLLLREVAPGAGVEEVQAATAVKLTVEDQRVMDL